MLWIQLSFQTIFQSTNFEQLGQVPVFILQVYTAEEKAALAMFNMEENKRKEQKILADMQRLVQKTLGESEEDTDVDAEAEEAAAS